MSRANLIDLRDRLPKLWEELFDSESLNQVDTIWGIQNQVREPRNREEEQVHYYPLVCQTCLDQGVSFGDSVRCRDHVRPLTDDHLITHFDQRVITIGKRNNQGAIGFSPCFYKRGRPYSKILVIDFDNRQAVEALKTKIIPELKSLNIDYLVEHGPGQLSYEKCHLWVKCEDLPWQEGGLFLLALLHKVGISTYDRRKVLKLELWPNKKSHIRLFGGIHLKRNCVYPINFKGKSTTDSIEMIDAFLSARRITREFVKQYIADNIPKEDVTDRVRRKVKKNFKYTPRNLPLPEESEKGMSAEARILTTNCQAINSVIMEAYHSGLLNNAGESHDPGLYLGGMCVSLDDKFDTGKNKKWFDRVINQVRDRDAEGHNWFTSYMPSCAGWSNLGMCDGCTFRANPEFTNPMQLVFANKIKKTKIRDIDPSSAEECRVRVVHKVSELVKDCINQKIPKDIVLAAPPGIGKSYESDRLACDLAREGKYVLIAVPNAELAQQHKRRCEQWGVRTFIVNSHENLFKKNKDGSSRIRNLTWECPAQEEIQRLSKLGISSKPIQNTICKKRCPFFNQCPWPGQYSRAGEDTYHVVIIQHAHLKCRETLFTLLSDKTFDLMIIDEEFIQNVFVELKPSLIELERFKQRADNYPWLQTIVDWLESGLVPDETLRPEEEDLEALKNFLEENLIPWNIPTYITYFNAGHIFDKHRGLFVFYPLPDIPVRLFTDATPPREMLEIVLDNPNLEMYGQEEVLDYRVLNQNTQIKQVLDSTTTKFELSKDEYALFYEWLEYIGDDIRARHKGKSVLITTYQDEKEGHPNPHKFHSRATEWLERNYPDIFVNSEVIISWMALGTNEYSHCKVQYQLAGVHLNTKQLYEMAYQIKSIQNWWNRVKGRPTVNVMYPAHIKETDPYEREYFPLQRVEFDPTEGPGVYEYEFDEAKPTNAFYDYLPRDTHLRMCFRLSLAKRQQAMRIIRNTDNEMREVIIFDKSERATQAVTESFLLEEKLGYLRVQNSHALS